MKFRARSWGMFCTGYQYTVHVYVYINAWYCWEAGYMHNKVFICILYHETVKWLCMLKVVLQSEYWVLCEVYMKYTVYYMKYMWSWAIGCTVVLKCTVCGVEFSKILKHKWIVKRTNSKHYFHNDEKQPKWENCCP